MKSTGKNTAAQAPVKSLAKALSLLECLGGAGGRGMNLSQLANELQMPLSTAHRLLNSMLAAGFVEFDEHQGSWSVGLKTFIIGSTYLKKRDFVVCARPLMADLVSRSGETSNLAILDDNKIIFIAQVECEEVMRMVVAPGSRGPAHATAVGKALLSALARKKALSIARSAGLFALTEKTITEPEKFEEELASIARLGYAIDDEEQKPGLRCIAANVYNEYGEAVCAISVSGPAVRIPRERMAQLSELVMDTARRITAAIGGRAE